MTDLRTLERESLVRFVQSCSEHFTGRVLDYGCGDQRYRPIVEAAGGAYTGWDLPSHPGYVASEDHLLEDPGNGWNTILCTQVICFVLYPREWLEGLRARLVDAGVLVITGPTNWPLLEPGNVLNITPEGAQRLLGDAGFRDVTCEPRGFVEFEGERWVLGWQAVARA